MSEKQTIDLILRIKETGSKALADLVEKIKKLQDAVNKTEARPVDRIAASAENLAEKFSETKKAVDSIDSSIERIEDTIQRVVQRSARQAVDFASNSLDRLGAKGANVFETSLSRAIAAVGGVYGIF